MTHADWWLMFDCRRSDKDPGTPGPNMSEDEMAELYELIK
jgi:hypothetical protein